MEAYAGQPADVSSSAAQLYADSQADGAGAVEALQVGSPIPDFTADSSAGEIEFYVEIDGGWSLFVTFHKTFDAVATTEVAALAKLADEFADRGVKVIANVCNTKTNNDKWAKECAEMGDCQITFPIVADPRNTGAREPEGSGPLLESAGANASGTGGPLGWPRSPRALGSCTTAPRSPSATSCP